MLFRDARFLVIDKPAGLPVHATRRGGANVEDVLRDWLGWREGPWLAHRLDADTAGCLLVALRRSALRAAQAAFAGRQARKVYWAVVRGEPQEESGVCEAPLRRVEGPAGWRMEPDAAGQEAMTEWRVRGRGNGTAWLELAPRTGRTHQVRAHCAALGCPVAGDTVYGGRDGALMLLARALSLPLEPTVSAIAPVPEHMQAALSACGWDGE